MKQVYIEDGIVKIWKPPRDVFPEPALAIGGRIKRFHKEDGIMVIDELEVQEVSLVLKMPML